MTVVVLAPNAFKGTVTAPRAAAALAAGWRDARPDDELVRVPLADGGDGTLEALAAAAPGAATRRVDVAGPVGGVRTAEWLLLPDGTAVVELASVGGLALTDAEPGTPCEHAARASTLGLGQVVAAALDAGCRELLLAVGGSASTDGGAGLLQGLGARLLDAAGRPVPPGNAGLGEIARVDVQGLRPLPERGVRVLADVRNPLLGPGGAVAVFAPQKGAHPADLPDFEARLRHWAAALAAVLPADPAAPGSGAAGGTAFAALAWGAVLTDGAHEVALRAGLAAALARADTIVTGEGRYDAQTEHGKAPQRVRLLAEAVGVPARLVAGSIATGTGSWADAVALDRLAGSSAAAMADAERWLRAAGAALAERYPSA